MASLPFDTLRGSFELGTPEDDYLRRIRAAGSLRADENLERVTPFDPRGASAQPGLTEAQKNAANQMSQNQAYNMRRAGFVENNEGMLVDPLRNSAINRDVRLQMLQEADRKEREAIADSMLFKAGDTLADTGRMFLSPLFWLKGEDQSQYDPSDRLKTGYRTQFLALEDLRDANYDKFQGARDARAAAAEQLDYQRQNLALSALSPEERKLRNFAARNNLMGMYADPLQQENLARMQAVQSGQGQRLTDSAGAEFLFFDNEMGELKSISKAFIDQTAKLREGFGNVERLMNLNVDEATGITDVAAIFDFIKGIDPGSVVRESEVNLFNQTIGLMDRIRLSGKKVGEGRVLSDDQLRELKKYAKQLNEMMSRKFNDRKQNARDALHVRGLKSEELQDTYLGSFKAPITPEDPIDGFNGSTEVIPGGRLDQMLQESLEEQIARMQGPSFDVGQTPSDSLVPGAVRSPIQ